MSHLRLLKRQHLSDGFGRTEATGAPLKVILPLRTELELNRWDRGPLQGHPGLRPWCWRSVEIPPQPYESCWGGVGGGLSPSDGH